MTAFRSPYGANPAMAALKNLMAAGQSSFRLDEGYSEDTRSQSGASDMAFRMDIGMDEPMDQDMDNLLPDWLMAMNEDQRSGMARTSLRDCYSN